MYKQYIVPKAKSQRLLHEVAVELTYKCNLKCFFCYNDLGKKGKPLEVSDYLKLFQDLSKMQTMFVMLTGGEPMVHPDFFEIGSITKDLGFVVRVRTNGHSLTKNIAQRVLNEVDPYSVEVSLHGASADTHDKQTRISGSFDKLVKNIRTSLDAGLRVGVISTPTKWNEHQISEMYELCERLGVVLRFQGPVAPRDNGDKEPLILQPEPETWDEVRKLGAEYARKRAPDRVYVTEDVDKLDFANNEAASCSVGVTGVDIDPFGNVQACMHLQESAGNIHEQSIEDIWNYSPLFTRAREKSVKAVQQFQGIPIKQFGAPLYCMAVAENINKTFQGNGGRS